MPERFNVCLYFPGVLSPSARMALFETLPLLSALELDSPKRGILQDLRTGTWEERDWNAARELLDRASPGQTLLTVYYGHGGKSVALTSEVGDQGEGCTISFPGVVVLGSQQAAVEQRLRSIRDWAEEVGGTCLLFSGLELELDLGEHGDPQHVVTHGLRSDLLAFAIVGETYRQNAPHTAEVVWIDKGLVALRIPSAAKQLELAAVDPDE